MIYLTELKKENKVENYLNLKHNEYDYQINNNIN